MPTEEGITSLKRLCTYQTRCCCFSIDFLSIINTNCYMWSAGYIVFQMPFIFVRSSTCNAIPFLLFMFLLCTTLSGEKRKTGWIDISAWGMLSKQVVEYNQWLPLGISRRNAQGESRWNVVTLCAWGSIWTLREVIVCPQFLSLGGPRCV